MAKGVAAIAVTQFLRLTLQGKGIPSPTTGDEAQGLVVVAVQAEVFDRRLNGRHLGGDGVTQFGAALQTDGEKIRTELEVIDLDAVHFAQIQVVAFRIERVGIVGFAQESGGATFAHHVGLLQGARQHDKRQHWFVQRLQADDV